MSDPAFYNSTPEPSSNSGTTACNTSIYPLHVSPSSHKPSDKIAPYLNILFPNVPERAKQNNVLLTSKDLKLLEYYLTHFDDYCPDYDLTFVIDGGALVWKEIQDILKNLSMKSPEAHQMGDSCVIFMDQYTHEYAARALGGDALESDEFRYWKPMALFQMAASAKLNKEAVCDFFDQYPQWRPSRDAKITPEMVYEKLPDATSVPLYCFYICKKLGMDPIPTLAIQGTNSEDLRKLFHDCMLRIAGTLIQVNAVIGVNVSPDTYSVDILNFDLTIGRIMELAFMLKGKQYTATRAVLYQVAKMKASVHMLQLRLLEYLLCNDKLYGTPEDVDDLNRYLQEDLNLAKEFCPHLGIRPLSKFPEVDELNPFLSDVKADMIYCKEILAKLRNIRVPICPQKSIAQCAYVLVCFTAPLSFGPISPDFILPKSSKVKIPRRAFVGIGNGYVNIPSENLQSYLSNLSPKQRMEEKTCGYSEIPLKWINDPSGLATERGIPAEQMTPSNYNAKTTLGGEVKYCYLTDQALQSIVQTRYGIRNISGRELAIWTLIQCQAQEATKRPVAKMTGFRNNVQRELGYPWRWNGFRRTPHRLLPLSHGNTVNTTSRKIHTTAFPVRSRRGFYPSNYPRRNCRKLWTGISRVSRY
uniref:ARAD1B06820p n=1 Tax=Blastobotrys adeninivorans TaxID=409370 RepID=A0A060T5G4_BLAAD